MSRFTQEIQFKSFKSNEVDVHIRREDLVHPTISGNKWHKLRYNLANAKKRGNETLLTFGGAYSNHIEATAIAGKEFGFKTIGVIRGEETLPLNSTLQKAIECGMQLEYVSRTEYRDKHTWDYTEHLRERFGSFYLVPEGGSNFYAINGCMEILKESDSVYDYICCPLGTGGTASGIALSLKPHQKLLGFPALKGGEFLLDEMKRFINMVTNDEESTQDVLDRVELIHDYHFGGYAKTSKELISFLQQFNKEHDIKWDLIYNGKMAYGVFDMIEKGYFPKGSKILLIHTGGLQGIAGFEERFKFKMY